MTTLFVVYIFVLFPCFQCNRIIAHKQTGCVNTDHLKWLKKLRVHVCAHVVTTARLRARRYGNANETLRPSEITVLTFSC